MNLLEVNNITTVFKNKKNMLVALRDISFSIEERESLGIVGESGSGKSVTVKTIMNILPSGGYLESGNIIFDGKDITKMDKNDFRKIQGKEMSMIFQDPMTALNPLRTIGYHIIEILKRHNNMTTKEAKEKAIELLKIVEIPNAEKRLKEFPHQFSGGMRQRVVIAMALACNPRLLIADEPTTALDVTIQSQILKLIKKLEKEKGMATILITHDLAVVYSMCKKIIVMYGGKIMESGTREEIFNTPKHPYTKALLNAIPTLNTKEKLMPIDGIAPSLDNMPKGCPFEPRCKFATEICKGNFPEVSEFSPTHKAYCFNSNNI